MLNVRALAEADLAHTIEGEFASVIVLIGPDGAKQTVQGRVRLCKARIDTETGEQVVVPDPNVTVRRSSLSPVPATGESWYAQIPSGPRADSDTTTYRIDTSRAPQGGGTLGTLKFPLVRVAQTEAA